MLCEGGGKVLHDLPAGGAELWEGPAELSWDHGMIWHEKRRLHRGAAVDAISAGGGP